MAEGKGDPNAKDKVGKTLPGALDPARLSQSGSPDPTIPRSERLGARHGQPSEPLDNDADPTRAEETTTVRSVLSHEVSVSLLAGAISAAPLILAFQSLNTLLGLPPEHAMVQTCAVVVGVVVISLIRGDGR